MSDEKEQQEKIEALQALVNKVGTAVNVLLPEQTPFILIVIPPGGHITFSNITPTETVYPIMRRVADELADRHRAEAAKKKDEETPGGLH